MLEKLEEMQWTVRQKDDSETEGGGLLNSNQTRNPIWGRNVGYNEETRNTNWDKRDVNATMDVRSDTQRQDQERTHPRNTESNAGCQRYHGATIELVGYGHVLRRDEEHIPRKVFRTDIPGKTKRERPTTRWKTCASET